MFYHGYNSYLEHAYPLDELCPSTCTGTALSPPCGDVIPLPGRNTWGNYSLTLVDALDTLYVMGNMSEFARAAQLVIDNVSFNKDINVSVFETNIRILGGLVSAHLIAEEHFGPSAARPLGSPVLLVDGCMFVLIFR
jgi:hypothetical protein